MFTNQPVICSWKVLFSLFCLFLAYSQILVAQECTQSVAWAVSIQGRVELKSLDESHWKVVRQGDQFCPGDRLRVSNNGRAGLILHNESLLRLAGNSDVRFSAPTEDHSLILELLNGVAHIISRIRHPYQINTAFVNAHIEGTEYTIESHSDGARVTVLEGQVVARNDYGEVKVSDGQRVDSLPGEAPQRSVVVNPRDAVQWALYYPPVIEPPRAHASEVVRRSLEAYHKGDLNGAFSALTDEQGIAEDVYLLVYRASLHLQVGGIEAARRDLAVVLRLRPDQPDALALMSLLATTNNEYQQAIDLARQAVNADNQSASAYLALSYAHQARFELSEAREAANQATVVAPQNALAWARLSQLELMFRNLDAAIEAADRAVEIAPGRALSQTTLGFARLIQFDLEGARKAFEQAASLDQAAPLPRLGLGLVQIRQGDMAGGRRQLEIAVNLDPGNALLRSYLGKAYYEEKRDTQAATQFTLAKQFDALDPTAWFYDAIRKQAANRPIEALKDIQTSIALNDNRAVYRSRLLLDQDEAARGASQARIYQDLGFDQLARKEAYKSLQTSTHDHSAHRLLADSYTGRPRYEKARLSELLQSQLLQPLNTTPIQPQLAVSNLGILDGTGPSAGGFSEYTPLFTRDGLNLQLNAIGGNNSTAGDDLILSGLKDKVSFSLGQFHHETDGWRENSDLRQDIYDAFLQYSLAPSTNVQFEYRYQDAESGDLGLKFDPMKYVPGERNDLERKFGRIGIHHQLSPNSHFIASAIYQDLKETSSYIGEYDCQENIPSYGNLWGTCENSYIVNDDSTARSVELEYNQQLGSHRITLGAGYYDEDYTTIDKSRFRKTFPLPDSQDALVRTPVDEKYIDEIDPHFKNIYIYSLWALPARVNMTIGAAFEDFESSSTEAQQLEPKFGLSWNALDNITLRAAYLKSLARPLHFEQSIEPTQVAGFNQRFDDVGGIEIEQVGLGIDAKLAYGISTGAEYTRRDLLAPLIYADVSHQRRDDKSLRGYLYWAVTDKLGMRLGYEREDIDLPLFSPQALTVRKSVGLSYHWPSGLLVDVEGTRISQEMSQLGVVDRDAFWNVDAVIGYRFPKRFGKVEIVAKNMLDKEFNYYDLSFHTGEQLLPQFQPERQLFVRFTLNF